MSDSIYLFTNKTSIGTHKGRPEIRDLPSSLS